MKLNPSLRLLPFAILVLAVLPGGAPAAEPKPQAAKTEATTTEAKPKDAQKMTDEEAKKKLTPMQYNVCMLSMTEPAFKNEYWNHHETGIYVDVISGKALFASTTKFDSGTGWPSFFAPIEGSVSTSTDTSFFTKRTEVHCRRCGGHLGHVFEDGPPPTGLRYCINGVALDFKED